MKTVRLLLALVLLLPLAAFAQGEPEAAYAMFHRAIVTGDIDEMLEHATAAQRTEILRMSPAERSAQLKMMSALMPRAYVLKDKSLNQGGQGARLLVSGAGPSLLGGKPETMYGTIRMVIERNAWKVGDASWSNTPPVQAPQAPAAKPAAAAQPTAPGKPAPKSAATPPKGSAPVGSMDSAPERRLGKAKEPCVFKPVMTAEDLENCK